MKKEKRTRSPISLAERGWLPDWLIRWGIKRLCKKRLQNEQAEDVESSSEQFARLFEALCQSPIAIDTEAANEQHYELPEAFFGLVLGTHRKYSSCYFESEDSLDQAEERSLAISAERAQLQDGLRILELGCGWGSLTLWMATQYPNAQITAVSNSHSQRAYIEQRAAALSLLNIEVITEDVNVLSLPHQHYDRVVSIEMLEHVRNYQQIFYRISQWLKPDGIFWCHVFCHRYTMYAFEDRGPSDWMSRYFFTGGLMPAAQTFLYFQDDLQIDRQWLWSGRHYAKTAHAWLENMDAHKTQIMPIFRDVYADEAMTWWHRWRIFFMACEELFGFRDGNEWLVAHYRFINRVTK